MMKNFMVSESVTWGMKLDEVLDESNTMPFPREAAVMMVYGRGRGGGTCPTRVLGPWLIEAGDTRTRGCIL
jgi:hypothetical protein